MPAHKGSCAAYVAGSVTRFPSALDKTLPMRAMTAAAEPMRDFERMGESLCDKTHYHTARATAVLSRT
jgi:hypothetical protein